jgi:rhodanese-related sulfurtransferase
MSLSVRIKQLFWWVPFGRVPEINPRGLAARLAGRRPPQILDVRSALEWRRSRIAGARNVPIQELRRRIDRLTLDPGAPVVAVCLSAHRSIPAVRLLQAKGFTQAVQLQGGMLAWWKQEYPTVSDEAGN